MIAVVQRVTEARVVVDEKVVGEIGQGLLVLAAVESDDTAEQLQWMANKLVGLRIFRSPSEPQKHFDLDVQQVSGAILLVSNFTIAAETRKGRRPSLGGALAPDAAAGMFERFVEMVRATGVRVETGIFGASMKVSLVNDGPATFIVDTRA
jgi:D-tyrosyl-tRNA(Tyr) deacylase